MKTKQAKGKASTWDHGFAKIPIDILLYIFSFLSISDRIHFSSCSKAVLGFFEERPQLCTITNHHHLLCLVSTLNFKPHMKTINVKILPKITAKFVPDQ